MFSRSACAFTAPRNRSDTCPSTTGDGTGFSNWKRMYIDSPCPVASLPMYPLRYSRSRHSTSSVMCPSSSSGMVAISGFYEKLRPSARRFEVEDLASIS